MAYRPLPRSFYTHSPEQVASALLGNYLVRNGVRIGKIIETEAYLATNDAAAHGFVGPTKRNASLYLPAGHAYVHQMRQWYLLDIVTEDAGTPSSVLIRAIEGVNGPGRVGRALAIDLSLDGIDVTDPSSPLFITEGEPIDPNDITVSTRIGISKATDKLLRFSL